ncbi:MAG TPA: TrmH family RNA methyltransferase [Solirubrobacteraceae bacterium]|nr:TrmH family RNA methyltransferase [Solirubrobacteraceae bacterium]
MQEGSLIPRFGRARRDPSLAVLEGFHPLKHALRFGANLLEVVRSSDSDLDGLAAQLAPDLAGRMHELARAVEPSVFAQLAPLTPATGVIALAERRAVDPRALLAEKRDAPVVLLEDPRDLGNLGACVRVAAGADAAGVLSTGSHDPWSPDALRGGAGLQFALPVARLDGLASLDRAVEPIGSAASPGPAARRPLLALDPGGEPLRPSELPARAVLAFGTERYGLSDELLAGADARISIPMRAGVSSLNLATSVAAVLFAWRLTGEPRT